MKTKYIQPKTLIVRLSHESMIAASQDGLNLDLSGDRAANVENTQEGGGYGLVKGNSVQWDDWE